MKTKISNIEDQNSEMNTYLLALLGQYIFISQSANFLVEDLEPLRTKISNIEAQNSEMKTAISKIAAQNSEISIKISKIAAQN